MIITAKPVYTDTDYIIIIDTATISNCPYKSVNINNSMSWPAEMQSWAKCGNIKIIQSIQGNHSDR